MLLFFECYLILIFNFCMKNINKIHTKNKISNREKEPENHISIFLHKEFRFIFYYKYFILASYAHLKINYKYMIQCCLRTLVTLVLAFRFFFLFNFLIILISLKRILLNSGLFRYLFCTTKNKK